MAIPALLPAFVPDTKKFVEGRPVAEGDRLPPHIPVLSAFRSIDSDGRIVTSVMCRLIDMVGFTSRQRHRFVLPETREYRPHFHGSRFSRKAQRPNTPSLFTAGIQSVRAMPVLAFFSSSFGRPAHLDNQIEQVVDAAAIVDADDVIGKEHPRFTLQHIRDLEAKPLILDVGNHFGHLFNRLSELGFPSTVANNVGNVAFLGVGEPGVFARIEADDRGGTSSFASGRSRRPAPPVAASAIAR